MTCGIYKITHRESGKCYIGQSVDIHKRWGEHKIDSYHNVGSKYKSNGKIKYCSVISRALKKYGFDAFDFEVLEECSREMFNDRETYWIAHFGSLSPGGYNMTSGGGQSFTVSVETRRKMSKALKGRKRGPISEEHRCKISETLKGRKLSEETRRKISEGGKGRKLSEETCRKISEAQKGEKHHLWGKKFSVERRRKLSEAQKGENNAMYGKKHSEESRRKMSENRKSKCTGENNPNYEKPLTEEQRRKISEALKGRKLGPFSEEHRRKISEALKGKPLSEETRRKMSENRKGHRPSKETLLKIAEAKKIKVECPFCGKVGAKNNMTRYHFDNCKNKPK